MKNKKNVAFFIYDATLAGGAEIISLKLANEFIGYNITVISLFSSKSEPVINLGDNVNYIFLNKEIKSIPLNIFSFSLQLRKVLKENNINFLLGITAGINSIAFLATLGLSTKWIYCEHSNLENQTYGKLHFIRQVLGSYFASKIVVLTERDKLNFIKLLKVNDKRISVIPNYFEPKIVKDEYDNLSKKIVSVGRLVSVKQFDHIINISEEIFNIHKDWEWHIYGIGEQENYLKELIINKNLSGNIKLMGFCKDIYEVLPKYAFLVMTSKYEGLPLTLLEAFSSKLPVISYDCPTGPSEIINHDLNGLLVTDQNLNELRKNVIKLINSNTLREKFSKNTSIGLEKYEKNRILELWHSLLLE